MKFLFKAIGTILIAAIGGLLVVVFEEPAKRLVADRPVTGEMYPAPWYPYPFGTTGDAGALLERTDLSEDGIAFVTAENAATYASLIITNEGTTDVQNARLRFDGAKPLAASFGGSVELFNGDTDTLVIPRIEAGDRVRVNLWFPRDLFNDFTTEIDAFYDDGRIPINKHKYDSWATMTYGDPAYWYAIEKHLPFFVFAALIVVVCLLGFMVAVFENYVRKLFASEDFYLNERVRYDIDPKKFQLKMD